MRNLIENQDALLKKKRIKKILISETIKDALRTYGLGKEKKKGENVDLFSIEEIDKKFNKLQKKYAKERDLGLKKTFVDYLKSKSIDGVKASEVYTSMIKGTGIYKFGMTIPFTSNFKFEWGIKVKSLSDYFGTNYFFTNDYVGLLAYTIACQKFRFENFEFVSLRPLENQNGTVKEETDYVKMLNGNTVVYKKYKKRDEIPRNEPINYVYFDGTADSFDYSEASIDNYLYSGSILPQRDEIFFPRITTVDKEESIFVQPWCLVKKMPKYDEKIQMLSNVADLNVVGLMDFYYKKSHLCCFIAKREIEFVSGTKEKVPFFFVARMNEFKALEDGNVSFSFPVFEKYFYPMTKEEYKETTYKFTRIIPSKVPLARGVFKNQDDMEELNKVSKIFYMGGKPDKAISQNVFVPPGTVDAVNLNVKVSIPAAVFINDKNAKKTFLKSFDIKTESGWNLSNIKKYIHFYLCSVKTLSSMDDNKKKELNSLWDYKTYVFFLSKAYKKTLAVLKKILKLQAKTSLEDLYVLSKDIADLCAYCQMIYDSVIPDPVIKFLKSMFVETNQETFSKTSHTFLETNFVTLRNNMKAYIRYLCDVKEPNRQKSLRDLTGYVFNLYSSVCLTNDFVSFNIAYDEAALDETHKRIADYLTDYDQGKKEFKIKQNVEQIENIVKAIDDAISSIEEKNVKYGETIKKLQKDLVGETSLDKRAQLKKDISFYNDLLRLRDPERWQLFKDKADIQKQIDDYNNSGMQDDLELKTENIGPETMKIIKYSDRYGYPLLGKDIIMKLID